MINRRNSVAVRIGSVTVGGGSPVVVQSMTDTDTANVEATVEQVLRLAAAGSELVRLTVNTGQAAASVASIKERLASVDCHVPLIGDFHYNGHVLLDEYPDCARALDKYRINPGNVGFGGNKDDRFIHIIDNAIRYGKAVRIGVNWGSLDQQLLAEMMDDNARLSAPADADSVMREALIVSALNSAAQAEQAGLARNRIILSCKVSRVQQLIAVSRELAGRCDYAIHLGLTEAGMGDGGVVSSTAALAVLLQQGIGDTIRISLTPEPGGDRTREVMVARDILQSMGLRSFTPSVTACPGCGRTGSTAFQELARTVQDYTRAQMPHWRRKYAGVETMSLAVMGCVVNGPGESKRADIGISLPGNGEDSVAPVFIGGKKSVTLRGDNIAKEFCDIIDNYVKERYS